jgi:hypothetical protein
VRRSNYIAGFGLSAILHVLLVVLLVRGARSGPNAVPAPAPPVTTPVQIASVDPSELVPLAPMSSAPTPDDGVTAEGGEEDEPTVEPMAVEPAAAEPAPRRVAAEPSERFADSVSAPPVAPAERVAMTPPAAHPIVDSLPPRKPAPIEPAPAEPTEHVLAEAAPDPAPFVSTPRPDVPTSLVGHTAIRAPSTEMPASAAESSNATASAPAARSASQEGDAVPPLRVYWGSASELLTVARALGMRLAAVNDDGDIIGEVDLSDRPALRAWPGLPFGYSNRVRMLSPSIFAAGIDRHGPAPSAEIAEIWIFVPADRDRSMVREQRDAVRRAGVRPEDVVAVDGQFIRAIDGSYELRVTNVHARTGDAS